jgi:hypothetical protein
MITPGPRIARAYCWGDARQNASKTSPPLRIPSACQMLLSALIVSLEQTVLVDPKRDVSFF